MAQPPPSISREAFVSTVDHVIRERKTAKILRDPEHCEATGDLTQFVEAVRACVEVAGWAPFHKVAHKETHLGGTLTSVVPWRFYILEKPMCCALIAHLHAQADEQPDSKWSRAWRSKIPKLLSGAGAAVLVTWLPDPSPSGDMPELSENNIEHIAAASAATQNLLLAAEARGMYTYWSSGGILRDDDLFEWLGIPRSQMLLGAIFLSPDDAVYDVNEPGGLRASRGSVDDWSVTIRKTP